MTKNAISDFGTLYAGREDISPNEKAAGEKLFNNKYQLDISSFFRENKDDKGVIKNYTATTADSINKSIQQSIDATNATANKLQSASSMLTAQIKERELNEGKAPDDAVEWYINESRKDPEFQKLSRMEKSQQIADFAIQVGVGSNFSVETETTPEGGTITRVVKGGKSSSSDKTGLQKSTLGNIETSIADITEQMFSVQELEKTEFADLFTYPGQIGNWLLDKKAKIEPKDISPKQANFLSKYAVFDAALGRNFDAYRAAVTKSQAAMRELEWLQTRVANKDMNLFAYKGVVNYTFDRLKRGLRLKRYVYEQGYTNESQIWAEYDKLYSANDDPTLSKENIDKRGDELADLYTKNKKNAAQDEIERFVSAQLKKEGYIP